jgi:hypothetical protein
VKEERLCVEKDDLEDWFKKIPKRGRGLCLLVHRWNKNGESDASLPFGDQAELDRMLRHLKLPRSFSYDFSRRQHIPARMSVYGDGVGKFLFGALHSLS